MTKAEAGRLGGKATVNKYGNQYMQDLARKGAAALWRKYRLVPVGTSQFILVKRDIPQGAEQ